MTKFSFVLSCGNESGVRGDGVVNGRCVDGCKGSKLGMARVSSKGV